jgi:ribose transport system permease protein
MNSTSGNGIDPSGPTRNTTARKPPPTAARRLAELFANYGLIFVFVVVLIVFSALRPATFLSSGNIGNLLTSQSVTALLAFAVMLPLSTGRFD